MLYIAVKKDYVEAGESYDYTITGNATSLAAIETAGTITVMPVTITSSEVAINFTGTDWNGVAASDISFLVNSSSNIEVDYDETDLDLINDITVDGLDGSYTAGDVSFTVSANTATAVTEATLTLPTAISAKLVAGESYTVEADLDLEVEDGDVLVEGTDYISTLKVDIEAAE
jgi:hypothetical protein